MNLKGCARSAFGYTIAAVFFYASHHAAKTFIAVECEPNFFRAVMNRRSPHCMAIRRYKRWLEDVTESFVASAMGAFVRRE